MITCLLALLCLLVIAFVYTCIIIVFFYVADKPYPWEDDTERY